MVNKKRRSKDWHHRVPDFKLVYCGTKKRTKEEEPKEMHKRRLKAMTKNTA